MSRRYGDKHKFSFFRSYSSLLKFSVSLLTIDQRTWKGDNVKRCMKCNEAFGFWNRGTHCRACGIIYCTNCCSHYVEFKDLAELAPPSRDGKCDVCMITYKDRIVVEG